MHRQPDDTSGTHSRRCLCCHGKGARGAWRLCRCCDPAPAWAHIRLLWMVPILGSYILRRWW